MLKQTWPISEKGIFMADKKQDLGEDFDDVEELEINDDQAKKSTVPADDEDDADESEDSSSEDSESTDGDEDLEAKRERRRREKKLKRERERRERTMLRDQVQQLQLTIKELKESQGKLASTVTTVAEDRAKTELDELKHIYNQANAAMEQAISDGDGKRFAEAKSISDRALLRLQRADSLKNTSKAETKTANAAPADDTKEEQVALSARARSLGLKFLSKHKSWYDPNGGDTDSRIVMMLDAELYNEGYSPDDTEYWEELESRCKARLPHVFKQAKPRPKTVVGGSGRDSSSAVGVEKSLPREFVQTLKAAGYWDDTKKRDAAIKDYYKNKQGA